MNITWIGHSALKLTGSQIVYIDPFFTGNPKTSNDPIAIQKADIVIVTHDHDDHIGDSFAICKNTGATLVSTYEIAFAASQEGITAEMMNVGGTINIKGVNISLVPALHTGGMGGTAVGVVVELDNKCIYHAGDTGLSLEMKLIGEMYKPDISFIPIDGRFTMTPRLAAKAVELLNTPKVVPIHYNTFPAIESSPEMFKKLVANTSEVTILNPGDSMEI